MPPPVMATVPSAGLETAVTVRVPPLGIGVVGQHVDDVGGGVLADGGGVVAGDGGILVALVTVMVTVARVVYPARRWRCR